MDSDDNRLKKLHNSKTQRDKELERIKSLAVVSVLNKNFKETTPPPRPSSLLPTLSPSSSLTTDNPSSAATGPDGKSTRSMSMSRSQTISYSPASKPLKKPSNTSLHHEHNNMSRTSSSATNRLSRILTSNDALDEDQQHHDVSEQELDDGYLVTNSPIDTEKETLEKRVQELEALYVASISDIQALTSQSQQQQEILLLQDKLIQHMSDQLDTPATDMQCQLCASDDVAALLKAQQDVAILARELNELRPLSSEYTSAISQLTEQASASEHKMDELEQLAREVQKANTIQTEFIDTKVQTLLDKILRKNEIINKLEQEQQQQLLKQLQYQQLPPTPVAAVAAAHKTDGNDTSNMIPEEDEDGAGEIEPNSARSSYVSHESLHGRKSYISRWKGNALPPASPPPSLPLPPIPSASSRSTTSNNTRPKSILSEISRGSSIHAQHTSGNKHLSMDAVGGVSTQAAAAAASLDSRRPSVQSQFDEELADAAYYKEFTDQLQERLSMSKEIDDLRVWEPSDYDSIQRKIDSKNWSDSEDEHSMSSQKAAFWKGMKKKLRV
ncbi:hypothetical protein V8B55DRAFT_1467506 [Mucor lusitanicus]|uniref:Uncharacterized protein n=2 Tax=Mucor circinelloides f. lusitanicus TaxID=29924 RepID=A0A168JE41_MUCCL|nr:hypothetical protein FB192DRAFT_1356739 [Mucor lusitanicus]OAD01072.1 hypothetical protein MUCCIDRAFT_112500 [Mucor lusitanicus CBS 277.49]